MDLNNLISSRRDIIMFIISLICGIIYILANMFTLQIMKDYEVYGKEVQKRDSIPQFDGLEDYHHETIVTLDSLNVIILCFYFWWFGCVYGSPGDREREGENEPGARTLTPRGRARQGGGSLAEKEEVEMPLMRKERKEKDQNTVIEFNEDFKDDLDDFHESKVREDPEVARSRGISHLFFLRFVFYSFVLIAKNRDKSLCGFHLF